MILVALGANLPTDSFGSPEKSIPEIINYIDSEDISVLSRAKLYKSAPVPVSNDPWFVNTVIQVDTKMSPYELMRALLQIELKFGRNRATINAPRSIDLDLLDYKSLIIEQVEKNKVDLTLPHPRMTSRAFVLLPLFEIAPMWKHPVTGKSISELIAALETLENIAVID